MNILRAMLQAWIQGGPTPIYFNATMAFLITANSDQPGRCLNSQSSHRHVPALGRQGVYCGWCVPCQGTRQFYNALKQLLRKNRSNFDNFGLKKLRSHRLCFKAEILLWYRWVDTKKQKKKQEIKLWFFILFYEELSSNCHKWRFSELMSKSVSFLIVISTIEGYSNIN